MKRCLVVDDSPAIRTVARKAGCRAPGSERATCVTILEGIAARMLPGATLFLGGTEKTERLSDRFKPVAGVPGVYRRAGGES